MWDRGTVFFNQGLEKFQLKSGKKIQSRFGWKKNQGLNDPDMVFQSGP